MILDTTEFAPYYKPYIDKTLNYASVLDGLKENKNEVVLFFENLPKDKLEFSYAAGKWTPKDILLHLIDAERIFTYRALRISRNDKTELPGFEEDDYVIEANANNRELKDLLLEFETVRSATVSLYSTFSDIQMKRMGKASNCDVSVRALAYMTLGHYLHHMQIIKERYL